jgi:hypothetical protein
LGVWASLSVDLKRYYISFFFALQSFFIVGQQWQLARVKSLELLYQLKRQDPQLRFFAQQG